MILNKLFSFQRVVFIIALVLMLSNICFAGTDTIKDSSNSTKAVIIIGIDNTHAYEDYNNLFSGTRFDEFRETIAESLDTESTNYVIEPITSFLPANIDSYDAIIAMQPFDGAYSQQEIDSIHNFVNNGGGLLLIGEVGGDSDDYTSNMNLIAEPYGVNFNDEASDPNGRSIGIDSTSTHTLVQNVSQVGVDGQRYLIFVPDEENTVADDGLTTTYITPTPTPSPTPSVSPTTPSPTPTPSDTPKELTKLDSMLYTVQTQKSEESADNFIAAHTGVDGDGNAVILSDSTLFIDSTYSLANYNISSANNEQLLKNIIKFIAEPKYQNNSDFVDQTVPTTMLAGQTYEISVEMKNNGNKAWIQNSSNPYRLGDDSWTWGLGRVELASGEIIYSGQSKVFTFNVTAPSTRGTYDMQWQMVQEGAEWFGEKTESVNIEVKNVLNNARFVSQTVPATMEAGKTYPISVVMKNIGTTDWVQDSANPYRLGDDSWTWGLGRVELASGETISPNESKTFTFNITAPAQAGQYDMQWQMVQENVEWFGDQTEKVNITVVDYNNAEFISQSIPTMTMTAGVTYTISVVMKNNGTSDWVQASTNPYKLANSVSSTLWGISKISLSSGETISPNNSKTFTFNITAPNETGQYDMQWQMMQENVGAFGELTDKLNITVADYNNAEFISQTVPTTMKAGETYSISVTMKNNGTSAWVEDSTNPYKLGNPVSSIWGVSEIDLLSGETIAPNQSKTFTFNITAPNETGQYEMQWQMMQENVGLFGELTDKVNINVPLNIAFIGEPQRTTFLSPDEKDAYNWAYNNYNVTYMPFSAINLELLDNIDVIWWHIGYDETTTTTTLPSDSTTDSVKNTINDFVSEGGGLFLSGLASRYVVDLELEASPTPNPFVIDSNTTVTSVLSGISIEKPQDPIFKDLSSPIYLLSEGLQVNSNYCVLSAGQFHGNWLGDWEGPNGTVTCGEYLSGSGKVIFLGADSYDWYIASGTNQYRSNIEKLTSNILQNLTGSLNISEWKKY